MAIWSMNSRIINAEPKIMEKRPGIVVMRMEPAISTSPISMALSRFAQLARMMKA